MRLSTVGRRCCCCCYCCPRFAVLGLGEMSRLHSSSMSEVTSSTHQSPTQQVLSIFDFDKDTHVIRSNTHCTLRSPRDSLLALLWQQCAKSRVYLFDVPPFPLLPGLAAICLLIPWPWIRLWGFLCKQPCEHLPPDDIISKLGLLPSPQVGPSVA